MNSAERIYRLCAGLATGQKFGFLKYDQQIRTPQIFKHVIKERETINGLYQALRESRLGTIERTANGSIKKWNVHHAGGAWDVQQTITAKGVFKGVIITVIVRGTVFVFKCGAFGVEGSDMHGRKAFRALTSECKRQGVDLEKYAVADGERVKGEIEKPIIKVFKRYREIQHVHHLDINSAWASACAAEFPELRGVFERLYAKDKAIVNMALGFCQSEYCGYRFAALAKAGINGTNERIINLMTKLTMADFEVVAVNTDGIWYYDCKDAGRVYTDEDEGKGFGKWKTDHRDCVFDGYSNGQYWFIEDGKFNVRARGYYTYEQKKPREEWDKEDFDKAMASVTTLYWDEKEGFVVYERPY